MAPRRSTIGSIPSVREESAAAESADATNITSPPVQGQSPPDPAGKRVLRRVSRSELAAYVIVTTAVILLFVRHLVPALIAGMVFYILLDAVSKAVAGRVSHRAVRPLTVVLASLIAVAAVSGAIAIVLGVVRVQLHNVPALMTKMAEILESTRLIIINFGGVDLLPAEAVRDADDIRLFIADWLKANQSFIGNTGEYVTFGLARIILACFLASMVYLRRVRHPDEPPHGPLGAHLASKVQNFYRAFVQVVGAQVAISAINTTLTAIYILAIVPVIIGRPLNFSYTMIFITFFAGLIPVLGNLISNTVILIVSLGASTGLAFSSLTFLIIIHKLEYVVNSKIVGGRTGAQVWEILMALLIGEAFFGIPGLIMGPIVYTFAKRELAAKDLI
jgi:predicted PurR-regulated permease PerM